MIIITNRNYQKNKKPEDCFGKYFNPNGPSELMLAEAHYKGGKWSLETYPNYVQHGGKRVLASEKVFKELQTKMRTKKKDCLFYVHGFNNDFSDVLKTARAFERNYGVEMVVFTWPANGGGVGGVASYKSDKREAKGSVNALDRTFERLHQYLVKYRDEACDQSFNLLLHSMGNYLFKNLLKSSVYQGETLLFDNVIMAAADVNNKGHKEWVNRIPVRKRLYICINEDDYALLTSRLKFGDNQLARLGHYTRNLNSDAVYLDFSQSKYVDRSHSYFQGDPLKNPRVKQAFHKMLHGRRAETGLRFNLQTGAYEI